MGELSYETDDEGEFLMHQHVAPEDFDAAVGAGALEIVDGTLRMVDLNNYLQDSKK